MKREGDGAFTRRLTHFAVEAERAARVAQIRLGARRRERQARARLGQIHGDVVQIPSLQLARLRVPAVQVELVLADGHVPNVLRERLRLAEPHDHAYRARLETPPISR